MPRRVCLMKRCITLVFLALGVLRGAAWAQAESVLYSFCAEGGHSCTDGAYPLAGLTFDQNGNLYGTTVGGGANGRGIVFKLTPEGKETVLYSFCVQNNCADGDAPYAGLVLDKNGNLYGTTNSGGVYNGCASGLGCGVVFKLTPKGEETNLYTFCVQTNCTDGANPAAGLVMDEKGNLYGTTSAGGISCKAGCGVVFKLTPKGKETVLYSFSGADGANPAAGLVFDEKGSLYGTTQSGGVYGGGAVFKLSPKGKETVLYSFCAEGGGRCTDGTNPVAGLVFDRNGNMYGTTAWGGAYFYSAGVVFKLTPKGKETILYSFCQQGYPCLDGTQPFSVLVFDKEGNLYGTSGGGTNDNCDRDGCGVVFKVTPKDKETALYDFCPSRGSSCSDGFWPSAGLVFDQKGNLYGTANHGGLYGGGVVFKLTP